MTTQLRVTMLGYESAGKTCYLAGMYRMLSLRGRGGFTIRTKNLDDGERFERDWERLVDSGMDRFPQNPGGRFDEHRFVLQHRMLPFMDLDWLDYRGGTLKQMFSDSDVQRLFDSLRQSDCVFLCVSGQYLRQGVSHLEAAHSIQVGRIEGLMSELIAERKPDRKRPLPLVIVVTKSDLCLPTGIVRPLRWRGLLRDIQKLFHPFFVAPHRGASSVGSYLATVCTVTLGDALAEDPEHGHIDPQRFHVPVFFAAWSKLRAELILAKALKENKQRIRELEGQVAALAKEIRRLPIYLEGRRVRP